MLSCLPFPDYTFIKQSNILMQMVSIYPILWWLLCIISFISFPYCWVHSFQVQLLKVFLAHLELPCTCLKISATTFSFTDIVWQRIKYTEAMIICAWET